MASAFRVEDVVDIAQHHKSAAARIYALMALLERRRRVSSLDETVLKPLIQTLQRDKEWVSRSDTEGSSRVCDFIKTLVSKYDAEQRRSKRRPELKSRIQQQKSQQHEQDSDRLRLEVKQLLAGLPSS